MSQLTAALAGELIHATTRRLDAAAPELSRLDAVAGDGDHGVNMAVAFHAAEAALAQESPATAGDAFALVGRTFSAAAGGSSGALFGAVFNALGSCLRRSDAPGAGDFVDGLELAAKRVALIGQTTLGSKTMLDALDPASVAARTEADQGASLSVVLRSAAIAAEIGAQSTAGMRAGAGRARHATNGAVGTRDPGAMTVALMFASWADLIQEVSA